MRRECCRKAFIKFTEEKHYKQFTEYFFETKFTYLWNMHNEMIKVTKKCFLYENL